MAYAKQWFMKYGLWNLVCGILFLISPLSWTSPVGIAFLCAAGHGGIPQKKVLFGCLIGSLLGDGGFGGLIGGVFGYTLCRMLNARSVIFPKSTLSLCALVSCLIPGLSKHLPYSPYDAVTVVFSSVIAMAACPVFSPLLIEKGNQALQMNREEKTAFLFLCAMLISGLMYLFAPIGALTAGLFALMFSYNGVMHALLASLIAGAGLLIGNASPAQAALILFSSAAAGSVHKYGLWAQAGMFLIGVPLSAYFGFERANAFMLAAACVYPWISKAFIVKTLRFLGFFDESSHSFLTAGAVRRHIAPKGKTICGDSGLSEKLPGGRMLFALSDGMGTGQDARMMSDRALSNVKTIFSAPLPGNEAMKCVNLLTQEKDRHATMDICLMDLVTGRTEFIKNGAEPSWIIGRGKVQRIEGEALPVGVLPCAPSARKTAVLSPGDKVFMATDGLLCALGGADEAEALLVENQFSPPSDLCARIIKTAKKAPAEKQKDDMSVLCIKIAGKSARIQALPRPKTPAKQSALVKKAG